MGIGGVIGQDEAREWIGTTKVAGATSGCGAASPEAGHFNGVSTVRYARFRSFTGCFLVHPTRRIQHPLLPCHTSDNDASVLRIFILITSGKSLRVVHDSSQAKLTDTGAQTGKHRNLGKENTLTSKVAEKMATVNLSDEFS